ncbi:DUF4097 family beta strand repeat-containing protein [Thalassotalea sp. G2M2-11]|uniref:DUF4097 family beta strand repeat-containing protein n=1 Tax=Thalassotalea sp. G2M2-11 TaxID=2787627 RepID=UPI0019D05069
MSLVLSVIALQVSAQQVNQRIDASGATSITIENQQGEVVVTSWQQEVVELEGQISDEAKRFIFERQGNQIVVKVIMPNHNHWNNTHNSTLTLKVPHNLRLSFNGISSDISISDMEKSSAIKTVSGNINVNNLAELVDLSSVSGDIKSRGLSGKISISSVSGDIDDRASQGRINLSVISGHLVSHSQAEEVSVNSVSGEVSLTLAKVNELSITTVSGDADARLSLNDNGLLKVDSVSGDISIQFDNNVQASFKMRANAGGDLINRLTDDKVQEAKYGPSSKLYFNTGNGSATVKASTVSGDIKVSR